MSGLVAAWLVAAASTQGLAALRAAVAATPGWVEEKDHYKEFDGKGLYGIIDGGAVVHEQQGLVRGVFLELAGSGRVAEIFVDDFGTAERAAGMRDLRKQAAATPRPVPRYADAAADAVLGGCVVFWARGPIYVELTLTGYAGDEAAARDAATLIDSLATALAPPGPRPLPTGAR